MSELRVAKAAMPGLSMKERELLARIVDRRDFLRLKFSNMPPNLYSHERAEEHALSWAIEVIGDYHEHINICDVLRVSTESKGKLFYSSQ